MLGFKVFDPIASIVVAIFVAKVGIEILVGSTNELMDVFYRFRARGTD